ncbi:GTP-binding protein [Derxia gummosa]|uniref:GTP-binding protein n=1 Tax=Derxia gummosa DSM 723 TaxID=1121388 RepID=A0A8B6X0T8_9BURK|nr:ATP/GTP-binding protein [Derxia gummosa]
MQTDRSRNHNKIVFAGTVGAGKSTAIAALSDIQVVSTEQNATDDTARIKKTTTVAMDYGVLQLPEGDKVMLYGTPGQERFSFMWEILAEGGIGLVLLVNNAESRPLESLAFYLEAFQQFIAGTAVVIGITHTDTHPEPTLADYRRRLRELDYFPAPAVFTVDARKRTDIAALVRALMFTLDPGMADA